MSSFKSTLFPALLALAALPTARADCWIDSFGVEHCSLATGARIGIAIAIIILALLCFASAFRYRRRRQQQYNAHVAYMNNTNNAPPYVPAPAPYGYASQYPDNGPQYPPQSYNGWSPQAGFAPPQGPPPGYLPPQGPPPGMTPTDPPKVAV